MVRKSGFTTLLALGVWVLAWPPAPASAHCDTLDGPVVADGRAALESGDVALALKWVGADHEPEVRAALEQARAVRAQGAQARALADRFFFETLVRLHRQGEGAPYTGLKPAGTKLDPAVAAADEALVSGSVDSLAKNLVTEVERGLRRRFERAAAAREQAGAGVERGREYVAAYVEFVHYVERLHRDATHAAGHHEHAAAPGPEAHRR